MIYSLNYIITKEKGKKYKWQKKKKKRQEK